MGEAKARAAEEERKRQVTLKEAEAYDWWPQFLIARLYAIKCMAKLGKSEQEISTTLSIDVAHLQRLKSANRIN